MRKYQVIAASISVAALTLGIGVWVGVANHERIEGLLGISDSHVTIRSDSSGDHQAPQMQAATYHSTANGKPLFHCGMHPWIIQDHPGTCPICHMELTPMQTIDPAVVQNMGVQTALVSRGSLHKTVRTVGYLEVPETGLYDVTLKVNGYIDKLYADKTGMHVKKGDPLFDLYSPDLTVAEEELIAARKSFDAMSSAAPDVRTQAQELMASARRKLQLWDIPDAEIDAIAQQDHAQKDITIRSPAEGHLEDKMVVQGSAVQAGMKLMRIENHATLWLEAKVYEAQLPMVQLGQTADATLDAMPGKTFSGKIIFINPHLDHMNRTDSVRIEMENPDFAMKPGMAVSVQIRTRPVEDAVLVPGTAVIDTGTRQLVFIAEEQGHFSPRSVTTGLSGDDDQVQVLSGLVPGEKVVTSGQFLMDVESRTLEAAQKFLGSAATQAAATVPATVPESTITMTAGESDGVVQAYLAVATYLGQDHADDKPANVSGLLKASSDLIQQMSNAENRPLAQRVKDSTSPLAGESLAAQRESFEKLGAAMLALIEKTPPSDKVAAMLYVMNCPMEKADWLQTGPTVNNPFLPDMRTCGSITRILKLNPTK